MVCMSHRGRLLVATPVIGDDNFDRTVVLLLEHGPDGALGLVLNRPTEVAVLDPLPEWSGLAAQPSVVFVGGPVEQTAAIALARTGHTQHAEGWSPVIDEIGTLDLTRDPSELDISVQQVRVFAGYAGWGPGQLEGELALDAWVVCDAEPGDALSDEPESLWRRVLRRQGGDTALLSYCPPDPSSN
jgi:putative transcriptional regulator